MIIKILRRKQKEKEDIVIRVYEVIVEEERKKRFYEKFKVNDKKIGSYEMIQMNIFIEIKRMKGENNEMKEIEKEIEEELLKDVDNQIREMGIGDKGVKKSMKKIERMFYGRVGEYGEEMDENDEKEIDEEIKRNIRKEIELWKND